MSIQKITLRGFRSVRNIQLNAGQLNVICGPNGCGKSNLYKAVRLLHEAACGRLSLALADEGGIQKAMWAGGRRSGDKADAPKRMILSVTMDDFDYELQLGFSAPGLSLFTLDPLVKEESLWLSGHGRRPSTRILERTNQSAFLTDVAGKRIRYPVSLHNEESVFGQLVDPHLYPELSQVRERLRRWRFYHEFATWPASALRIPQPGIRSPVLAHNGSNLAAAFQTIIENGNAGLLHRILREAFPDCQFSIEQHQGRFQVLMQRNGILRPLEATELSEGTLRFLCLTVAMLSPSPPSLMAFNEPENSLHPQLLPALAQLIAEASRHSQLWITSHSTQLIRSIQACSEMSLFELCQRAGETVLADKPGTVCA